MQNEMGSKERIFPQFVAQAEFLTKLKELYDKLSKLEDHLRIVEADDSITAIYAYKGKIYTQFWGLFLLKSDIRAVRNEIVKTVREYYGKE